MTRTMVLVGGGLAAGAAAVTLREEGHAGPIVLYSAEEHVPYERPGLSKGYLAGTEDAAALEVVPPDWYAEHDVTLRLGTEVTGIDTAARTVTASDGSQQAYDELLLATGAAPRHLAIADAVATGPGAVPVCYLRTREDSDRLRALLQPGHRLVVIGGGFLGLEVAATARTGGADVTIIETMALPLAGVLGDEVGFRIAEVHRAHGVDLRLGARITAIRAVGGRAVVDLAESPSVTADVLVVGVGAAPRTGLAEAAGLEVRDGVVVDEHLRTSDPHVLAAGDVARTWHPGFGEHIRIEHWANAKVQGAVAARTMLGQDAAHGAPPYFFTDQYDLGMEYFGYTGRDLGEVVVEDGDPGSFAAYYARAGVLRAALHVNQWDRSDELKGAVTDGVGLDAVRRTAPVGAGAGAAGEEAAEPGA